jgi:hypothetical protein
MSQTNETKETQLTESPAPWAPKPRDRRALSAYRHGLTGQIQLFTDADRAAYEKHCRGYHESLTPRGYVETDLVQAIADDRWRLRHAACLESGIFAEGITQPDEVTSGNAEVDTALAQARVWISKGGNLQLLGLYESRIQRRFEKNMGELRTLQADRKAAIEETLEEVDLLCQLAESRGEHPEPSQFTSLTRFDFSGPDISRLLLRLRNLREARKQFQSPRKPSKLAA